MESNDIQISPLPRYLGRQGDQYAFAYTIHIANRGNEAAQLISRHWIITHGSGQVEEVKGEGVVGKQPRLEPGQEFSYTSGALLNAPSGSMHGSYRFVTDAGETVDIPIPEFAMVEPSALH